MMRARGCSRLPRLVVLFRFFDSLSASRLTTYLYKPLSPGSELLITHPFYPTQLTLPSPRPITSQTVSVVIPLPITIPTATKSTPSSSDTTNNTKMQSEHVITKMEDFSNDEFLAVFTMSGDYVTSAPGPSMPGHRRDRSSESASSLVERSAPMSRVHPSLPYARTSPNSATTSLPGQDMRFLSASAVPPAFTTSSSSSPSPRIRRRASPSEEDDDDYVDDLPPNATDQERAEHKRRLNTLAARRSRRRRLAEFQRLNDDVSRLSRECDLWKERAMMMARMMSAHGLSYPPLPGVTTLV